MKCLKLSLSSEDIGKGTKKNTKKYHRILPQKFSMQNITLYTKHNILNYIIGNKRSWVDFLLLIVYADILQPSYLC